MCWMGENHFAALPVAVYGFTLLMPDVAYFVLQSCIVRVNGDEMALADALGYDIKGKISLMFCAAGIGFADINSWIALGIGDATQHVTTVEPQPISEASRGFEISGFARAKRAKNGGFPRLLMCREGWCRLGDSNT